MIPTLTLAIVEMIRLLHDEERIPWDDAGNHLKHLLLYQPHPTR